MFYLYILYSEINGKYYVGSTADLKDRIERHNAGRSKSTKSGVPWKIVYTESFVSRSEAIRREYEIKSWKSHKRITELIKLSCC